MKKTNPKNTSSTYSTMMGSRWLPRFPRLPRAFKSLFYILFIEIITRGMLKIKENKDYIRFFIHLIEKILKYHIRYSFHAANA